jgi:hypothetical protein
MPQERDLSKLDLERRALTLPVELGNRVETALLDLRLKGQRVSFSGFTEVALNELLADPDLIATLKRAGAKARRKPETKH